MGTTVQKWTGREAAALRLAMRASVRGFAETLGVSARTVSKWASEGSDLIPRPETQAILDTTLSLATSEQKERFFSLTNGAPGQTVPAPAEAAPQFESLSSGRQKIRHPVDGKQMVLVEAGVFLAGDEREPLWLDSFYIDVTLTTNADYARFISATGYQVPPHWRDGVFPEGLSSHPVVNVSHVDASAYAKWASKELPSSTEWEKAARGTAGNEFPWGNQVTPAKCNVRETNVGHTTPVNRYHSGVSPYGVYDMTGNTWEWCRTPTEPNRFVLKGSAFTSPLELGTCAALNDASKDMFDDDTGFRCVVLGKELRAGAGQ